MSGQAVTSFIRLDAALRELGIFMVEQGELERFHPEVPSANKAVWLRTVLEGEKFRDSDGARKLVSAVMGSIVDRQ